MPNLVTDLGHLLVPVKDMDSALAFYRDLLGFQVEGEENPVWTVVAVQGGRLTLYRQARLPPIALGPDGRWSPYQLHVANFKEAADLLESEGHRVMREDDHTGAAWDPFGNVLGLHDHREAESRGD